ncbi:CBS domain-containing protein [Helcobacillus massiliensis]|uniref:CBS domain-containing protein n=1 Tax=Helcobacillus massiliensis TaxID=521392 RepID=A0A839QV39_9MICO|nr:CBS domain-containing protein [Helcobacillus massiliensis]MBB3021881.1 CBS domain-containing protein [Helcobacillus massiliensis]
MPDNAAAARYERFIQATEEIKVELGKKYRTNFTGFGAALHEARKRRQPVVSHNWDTLDVLISLRNVLQHSATRGGEAIAAPRQDTVDAIERIRDQIRSPTPIKDFAQTPLTLAPDDPLAAAAHLIVERNFSQAPVYDGSTYTGLFTTNAMARWLSRTLLDDELLLNAPSATVADVLKCAEEHERPIFRKPTASPLEACEDMAKSDASRPILVTTDGTDRGALQGIVTSFEIPRILHTLSFSLS